MEAEELMPGVKELSRREHPRLLIPAKGQDREESPLRSTWPSGSATGHASPTNGACCLPHPQSCFLFKAFGGSLCPRGLPPTQPPQ